MTKNLRCPQCDDTISASTDWVYSSMIITGFECDNVECNAAWDNGGDVIRESFLTTDPESVD